MTLTPPDPRAAMVVANVSGGKDSTALSLHLAELGIEHRRVFADTGWEHPDTYAYLDEIEAKIGMIERVAPLLPMEALVRKKGMFPGRMHRFCTSELKVKPINSYMATVDPEWRAIVALGIRADESAARAKLAEWEHDGNDMERWTWRPLIAWTIDDVFAIHKRHGIRLNPLYGRGASTRASLRSSWWRTSCPNASTLSDRLKPSCAIAFRLGVTRPKSTVIAAIVTRRSSARDRK